MNRDHILCRDIPRQKDQSVCGGATIKSIGSFNGEVTVGVRRNVKQRIEWYHFSDLNILNAPFLQHNTEDSLHNEVNQAVPIDQIINLPDHFQALPNLATRSLLGYHEKFLRP